MFERLTGRQGPGKDNSSFQSTDEPVPISFWPKEFASKRCMSTGRSVSVLQRIKTDQKVRHTREIKLTNCNIAIAKLLVYSEQGDLGFWFEKNSLLLVSSTSSGFLVFLPCPKILNSNWILGFHPESPLWYKSYLQQCILQAETSCMEDPQKVYVKTVGIDKRS